MLQGKAWLESPERRHRDVLYVSALLPFALPVTMAGLGLVRLIDGGNPLFEQKRLGKNGQTFDMYKVRSMPADTPPGPGFGPYDPRASKLGRLLRISNIDELPQLYNILAGDMSLFGPRAVIEPEHEAIEAALSAAKYRRWLDVYNTAGPGCISTFGHASRSRNFHDGMSYDVRTDMDIYDAEHASPEYDKHLLRQIGKTGLSIIQEAIVTLK